MWRSVLVLMVFLGVGVPAQAQSPEEVIRWLYLSEQRPVAINQSGLWFLSSPEQRRTYFTKRMVAFWDANDSYNQNLAEACIDFYPAVPGQDSDAAEIARTLRTNMQGDAQRLTVTADFTNFGEAARISYDFVTEDGFWKIDDIAGPGFRLSEIPCTPKAVSARPPAQSNAYCFQTQADSLRLDLLADGSTRLEFLSWQSNGHSCSGELTGQQTGSVLDFHAEQGCLIQLRAMPDGGVQLSDQDNVCKFMMCGQRALIDGLQFPHTSRVDCANWQGIRN